VDRGKSTIRAILSSINISRRNPGSVKGEISLFFDRSVMKQHSCLFGTDAKDAGFADLKDIYKTHMSLKIRTKAHAQKMKDIFRHHSKSPDHLC